MATHSSILAWQIPWTEEPGGLKVSQKKVGHHLVTKQQDFLEIKLLFRTISY